VNLPVSLLGHPLLTPSGAPTVFLPCRMSLVARASPKHPPHVGLHLLQEGRFAFTALQGEHHLCLSVEGQSLGQDFRIHLEIKVGLNDVDYEKVAKKEHLSSLELQVRKLKDDVNRVTSEQSYFRNREERSKKTADSTYFRAMVSLLVCTRPVSCYQD